MNITIILAGGVGARFDSDMPKQYHLLNGIPVIEYAYRAARKSALTSKIIIVSEGILRYEAEYVKSGSTHNKSVKNAIDYINTCYSMCEKVLFMDSVRPFVTSEILDKYFSYLDDFDAVITAQKITDSLGKKGTQFVDRAAYFLIQKPEAFNFHELCKSFCAFSDNTAIVQQLPVNARILNCFELKRNMKITYPEDLLYASAIMDKINFEQ